MNALETMKPLWIMLENVDVGDCSEEDSNGAVISKVLSEAGYETSHLFAYVC
jgi:hypothetical protein